MQREISRGRLARQARIIKVPVLAIAGEEDQIVDPQATSDWASAFPTSEVVMLEDAGHMPMLEKTGEFNTRILAFLTGDPRYLDTADEEMVEDESPSTTTSPKSPSSRSRTDRTTTKPPRPLPASATASTRREVTRRARTTPPASKRTSRRRVSRARRPARRSVRRAPAGIAPATKSPVRRRPTGCPRTSSGGPTPGRSSGPGSLSSSRGRSARGREKRSEDEPRS
jgi:hypothetical protein